METHPFRHRSAHILFIAGLIVLCLSLGGSTVVGRTTPGESPSAGASPASPVTFVENVGQFDARARFQAQGPAGTLWLTEDGVWITRVEPPSVEPSAPPDGPRQAVHLRLSFTAANPHPRLEPFDRQETVMHYYYGDDPGEWHTDVPVWGGVRYHDLYPGVDLVVGTGAGTASLPWRLEAREGADLSAVRLQVEGAEAVAVAGDHLRLDTPVGQVALPLLTLIGPTQYSQAATVAPRDRAFEITAPYASPEPQAALAPQVDYPEEFYFGSYLGGSDDDWVYDVAVSGWGDILDRGDDSRSIWIAGWATSSNFPTAPGTTSLSGSSDAYVAKMKRGAVYVALDFGAYVGGSNQDAAQGIAVDPSGNAYVTGWTRSNDFPTPGTPYDGTYNDCMDAFALKMDGDGNLHYGTYLGGTHVTIPGLGDQCGDDNGQAVAVDGLGIMYLTGSTASQDFPTTPGAHDTEFSNPAIGLNVDTFVVKLDPSQGTNGLLYSTFVGGGTSSWGQDIAVDGSGRVYVTGDTSGGPGGTNYFPTTPGAYDEVPFGDDAMFFKLDPAGNGAADLLYSTALGVDGSGEYVHGIALDGNNRAYVCGKTFGSGFPTTTGAMDTTCGTDDNCNSRSDYFVSQFNPAGNGAADLVYSTYLGGDSWEGFYGECDLAVGSNGDVYVTGDTGSTSGFPLTADAYDLTGDASWGSVFVTRLRPQGNGAADLIYSTYVNGSYTEGGGTGIALDDRDRVYVVGETQSNNFPTTDHALYKTRSGLVDWFVFRLVAPPVPDLSGSSKAVAPDEATVNQVVTYTVRLVNGNPLTTTVAFTDTLPAELILQGSPAASGGPAPGVNGQTITWTGDVGMDQTINITYATMLSSTTVITPAVFNKAYINDGYGTIHLRSAWVNGTYVYLPLVMR